MVTSGAPCCVICYVTVYQQCYIQYNIAAAHTVHTGIQFIHQHMYMGRYYEYGIVLMLENVDLNLNTKCYLNVKLYTQIPKRSNSQQHILCSYLRRP